MIYFELCDKNGEILFSNIDECVEAPIFEGREKVTHTINEVKNIFRESSEGFVRLIAVNERDVVNSSSITTKTVRAYEQLIKILKKYKSEQTDSYTIFFHNLINTHTKLQGEAGSIVCEFDLIQCEDHQDQLSVVAKAIKSDIEGSARAVLEINKRIVDLQAQIEGFKILSGKGELDFGSHNIKRVLLNILYPFYEDFKKLNIKVRIGIDNNLAEANKLKIDYKIFNVAMHHFFNNALKYCKPYSVIDINFDADNNALQFTMLSVRIEKGELKQIYDLGISGRNAGEKAGEGVGMYMIKRSLDLLGAKMSIYSNHLVREVFEDFEYVENRFFIYFNVE